MKRIAATALLAMGLLHGAAAGSQDEQAAAETARAAAARQLKAPAAEFTVVAIEAAQWSDSSLGCPKQGSMYTDVMSSGYTVLLERKGEQHRVNVAGSRAVICDANPPLRGTVRKPVAAPGLDHAEGLARQDLAHRLHLDVQHIQVAKVEARRWTDDDMNCASGGGIPAAAAPEAPGSGSASGYRLALSASGRTYFYHTDLRSVRACPPLENQ